MNIHNKNKVTYFTAGWRVCMLSLCLCGFSPSTPASFHCTKTWVGFRLAGQWMVICLSESAPWQPGNLSRAYPCLSPYDHRPHDPELVKWKKMDGCMKTMTCWWRQVVRSHYGSCSLSISPTCIVCVVPRFAPTGNKIYKHFIFGTNFDGSSLTLVWT